MAYYPSDVRAWAQERGEPVHDRGRLSYGVVADYFKAHPQVARSVAAEHGLQAPARGTVSREFCRELAVLVR